VGGRVEGEIRVLKCGGGKALRAQGNVGWKTRSRMHCRRREGTHRLKSSREQSELTNCIQRERKTGDQRKA